MKTKLLSIVFSVALGALLLTGCMKNEESEGVYKVRDGYANLLNAQAAKEKAEADYRIAETERYRLITEWEVLKAYVDAKTQELELMKKQALYAADVELALKLYEVALQQAINELQLKMHAYAQAVYDNEVLIIAARRALALAQAQELADNPKLALFNEYYNQLFDIPTGYYQKRLNTIAELNTARTALVNLALAPRAELYTILLRDSIDVANNIKRTNELIETYNTLAGKTVDELQRDADNAQKTWKALQVAEEAAKKTAKEKEQIRDAEVAKWNAINDELTTNVIAGTDPMGMATGKVADVVAFEASGLRNAVKFAEKRLAYLGNTNLTLALENGYQYTSMSNPFVAPYNGAPTAANPSMAWIANELAKATQTNTDLNNYINNTQKNLVTQRQIDFNAVAPQWTAAKSAYDMTVTTVNNAVKALRGTVPAITPTSATPVNTIADWKAKTDAGFTIDGTGANTVTAAFANNARTYLLARLQFDMPTFTTNPTISSAAGVTDPAKVYDQLYAFLNNPSSFTAAFVNTNIASLDFIFYDNNSDLQIIKYYEPGFKASDNTQSAAAAAIQFKAPPVANPAPADEYFTKTTAGKLLLLSRQVYGAGSMAAMDVLPLSVKPNTVPATLTHYNASLFGLWMTAKDDLEIAQQGLATSQKDKDDYTALQTACQASIDMFTAFLAKYQPLLADAETRFKAQTTVKDAAAVAYVQARAAETDATRRASDAEDIYNLMQEANTSSTLANIKAYVIQLKNDLGTATSGGYINQLIDATKALSDFRNDTLTNNEAIANKQKEIDYLVKVIADLDAIIASIEAKMKALLS